MQHRGINIISLHRVQTGPEAITLAEAKVACKVTGTDFDDELTALIPKATSYAEEFCSVSVTEKRVTLHAEFFEEWELPYGPVKEMISVESRARTEGSGPAIYETVEVWETDGEDFKTFIPSNVPFSFSLRSLNVNRLRIVYIAGYDTVPTLLKEGILNILVFMFNHRGEENLEPPSEALDKLIPFKRMLWL